MGAADEATSASDVGAALVGAAELDMDSGACDEGCSCTEEDSGSWEDEATDDEGASVGG